MLVSRLTVALLALSCASVASAQDAVPAPLPGGVFGATDSRTFQNALDFSWSMVGGYDSEVPLELRAIPSTEALVSGASTMFLGHSEYRWQGSRVRLVASGESALRHFNEVDDYTPVSYSGGVSLSARLDGRTTLSVNQRAAYSPSYLYGLFPSVAENAGTAVPVATDYAVSDTESYVYGTRVKLGRDLSRRTGVSATGDFEYTNFLRESALQRDLTAKGLGGELWHRVSPNVSVQTGYTYRTGTFGYGVVPIPPQFGVSATEHGLNIGFRYERPLSAARRMLIAVSLGPSRISAPRSVLQELRPNRFYPVTADAVMAWQFSRSWTARGTYRRGLEYIADLTTPVFADGFTAEIAGLCTSRLDVSASARYSTGASLMGPGKVSTFDTSGTDLRVRYALTSALAVYGEYLYYYYDFRNAPLSPGRDPGLTRHAVRAGLTLWVRALRR